MSLALKGSYIHTINFEWNFHKANIFTCDMTVEILVTVPSLEWSGL